MKEMIYKEPCYEVLDKGEYLGRKYFIISYGTHPCAYIENLEGYTDYYDECLDGIEVHGGFTFLGEKEGVNCLGWDYSHCCDYSSYYESYPYFFAEGLKRWTTEEIQKEVFDVIEQMGKVGEENEN